MSRRALCIAISTFICCIVLFQACNLVTGTTEPVQCRGCSLGGSNLPCVCLQYPIFFNGMFYFYYAHSHDDCENCAVFDTGIYISQNLLDGQDCSLGECPQGSAEFTEMSVHLKKPYSADFDLADELLPSAKCSVESAKTALLTTPEGRTAKVKMFRLRNSASKTDRPDEVTIGFEVLEDGTPPDIVVSRSKHHEAYKGVCEFELDGMPAKALVVD
jgi:hypothetical protein